VYVCQLLKIFVPIDKVYLPIDKIYLPIDQDMCANCLRHVCQLIKVCQMIKVCVRFD